MPRSNNIFSYHPGKALYTAYFLIIALVKVPFIFLYYIPQKLRPFPSWTYGAAVGVYVVELFLRYASAVEFKAPKSLEPGKEGDRFVVIEPGADDRYTGILKDKKIKPEVIGGVWYPAPYSTDIARDKKIILHIHGGGFVIFGARERDIGFGARNLSAHFDGALVFAPQYRLATAENGRFPAAIQDALSAYLYLLEDLQTDSSRIIFSGDSAGGSIILALLRYISETKLLPYPVAMLLWSPWVNVSDPDHVSSSKNRDVDMIRADFLRWGVQALTDHSSAVDPSNRYISPLQAPFNTPVPIWITMGSGESFYESIKSFTDVMQAKGNKVKLHVIIDAPHDLLLGSKMLGFRRELNAGMDQAWELITENSWE
ncbi:hypothetical protein FQN49_007043 [Arthroderma sp. PD_2]|nr:hypothetical protein FQN49_007043 [Arthroderma sp. PD_2]